MLVGIISRHSRVLISKNSTYLLTDWMNHNALTLSSLTTAQHQEQRVNLSSSTKDPDYKEGKDTSAGTTSTSTTAASPGDGDGKGSKVVQKKGAAKRIDFRFESKKTPTTTTKTSTDSKDKLRSSGNNAGKEVQIPNDLLSAVKSVAEELGGDTKETESELIQKLKGQTTTNATTTSGKVDLSQIFSGMKIDRGKRSGGDAGAIPRMGDSEPGGRAERVRRILEEQDRYQQRSKRADGRQPSDEREYAGKDRRDYYREQRPFAGRDRDQRRSRSDADGGQEPMDEDERSIARKFLKQGQQQQGFRGRPKEFGRDFRLGYVKVDLFGSEPLGIFSTKPKPGTTTTTRPKPEELPKLSVWDALYTKDLKLAVTHPPKNGFDEMILWTEQGKLWKFPIDNEQGREEEAKTSFHEHLFLEPAIESWCPKQGPVRQFMELVCIGLGKNPYISVKEKHEYLEWYHQYFQTKSKTLKETGAGELKS